MSTQPIISASPPQDGKEYDCQCARCGSSMIYEHCTQCGGAGMDGHDCGDDCCCCLYPEENVTCDVCDGEGGWNQCCSDFEWCKAHPLEGREQTDRGLIEWFAVERKEPAQ